MYTPNEKLLDKEWLANEYVTQQKSMSTIAKEIGVTKAIVSKYIKRYGFPQRSAGEAKTLTAKQKGYVPNVEKAKTFLLDKEWLYKRYILEGASTRNIADEAGLKNRSAVKKALEKFQIPIRSLKEARHNRTIQGKEHRRPNPNIVGKEDYIIEQYTAGKAVRVLKEELGATSSSIQKILTTANITLRDCNEARIGQHHSEETKLKMSQTAIDQILSGTRSSHGNGKRMTCLTPNDGFVVMRSSWEKKYAEYLKNNKIDFFYEPKAFQLSNNKSYVADFYLPATDEYIEIKGFLSEDQSDKYALFKTEYPNLKWKILYKESLIDLGLDLSKELPTVYLVCGVPGAGKSWICEQLKDKINYISYDDTKNDEERLTLLRNTAISLYDPTFKISTFIKRYSHEFNLIPLFIIEKEETLKERLIGRGGEWTESLTRRIIAIDSRSKKYGQFSGTSQEVLNYLKSQLLDAPLIS
jgi:transposase-like protein